MFKVKQLAVTAAITLFAGAAMASNFRAGDQVYVPAAGHISSASATFVSDIFISNLSDDSVDVSVIFAAGSGAQTPFPKIVTLQPRERRELRDFLKNNLNLSTALGQLIFNACKANADCTPDATTGLNSNYRNISVESRIYSVNTPNADTNALLTAPTTGQLFSGIPWYNFVTSDASGAGLDKVFITGIRNTDQYRTNMIFVNASQFSTTTLTATLFSGTGAQLAQNSFTLAPLASAQTKIGSASLFPSFVQAPTSTGAYVIVQQGGTTPTPDAAANGCLAGCPAFFAFGSQLDNQTNDPTTLEPQYLQPLTSNAIACIYAPDVAACNSKGATGIHRAAKHQF
jgi:hypothetical protein